MKARRRQRNDLLDVLLEIRAAEEGGQPMPPIQSVDYARTGWTATDRETDRSPADALPPLACRECSATVYIPVGRSRRETASLACAGCCLAFLDPE